MSARGGVSLLRKRRFPALFTAKSHFSTNNVDKFESVKKDFSSVISSWIQSKIVKRKDLSKLNVSMISGLYNCRSMTMDFFMGRGPSQRLVVSEEEAARDTARVALGLAFSLFSWWKSARESKISKREKKKESDRIEKLSVDVVSLSTRLEVFKGDMKKELESFRIKIKEDLLQELALKKKEIPPSPLRRLTHDLGFQAHIDRVNLINKQ